MSIEEIADWIANDQSDFAQRVREMFRPFSDQLQTFVIDFMYIDHRHMMRRKIRRCYR